MSRSRSAAVFLVPFLLFVPLTLALTTAAPKGSFKDTCKAGYIYVISPSSTGDSVKELRKYNCQDPENNSIPECKNKTGEIFWECKANSVPSDTNCKHKTCKEGQPVGNPTVQSSASLAPPAQQPATSASPPTLPLPPLTSQPFIPGASQPTTGQGTQPSILDAKSLTVTGGLVPNTGGGRGSFYTSPNVNASDAATLQGGTVQDIGATAVKPSAITEGGSAGDNTFVPQKPSDQIAQVVPVQTSTWQDKVSSFLGCTIGYIFGGCNSAAAENSKTDAQVIAEARMNAQPNVTVVSVTPNSTGEIAPAMLSPQTAEPRSASEQFVPVEAKGSITAGPSFQGNNPSGASIASVVPNQSAVSGGALPPAGVLSPQSQAQDVFTAQSQPAPVQGQIIPFASQGLPLPAVSDLNLKTNPVAVAGGNSVVAQNNTNTSPSIYSQTDLSGMSQGQIRAIEDANKKLMQDLADSRAAQVEAKNNIGATKDPVLVYDKITSAAFTALVTGDTKPLAKAWNDAYAPQPDSARVVPLIPVEQGADLAPPPGTEPTAYSSSAQPEGTQSADLAPTVAAAPVAPSDFLPSDATTLLKNKALTDYVIVQKSQEIEAARADLQARTDAYAASTYSLGYSDITQGAAWTTYEQWWKEYEQRVDAFTAQVSAYRSGDQAVVGQVDAALKTPVGGTSEWVTNTADAIRSNGNDVWNQTPSFWDNPVAVTFGGAVHLTEQTVASTLEAGRNIAEQTGLLGESVGFSDPQRAIGRVFDPVGSTDQLAKDTAQIGAVTVAPWAAGRVAGYLEGGVFQALPKSVTTDVRLVTSDSAGFASTAQAGVSAPDIWAGARSVTVSDVGEGMWYSKPLAMGVVGGFGCAVFCLSEAPPQEPVQAEILTLDKETIALLFGGSGSPAPSQEAPPPAAPIAQETPAVPVQQPAPSVYPEMPPAQEPASLPPPPAAPVEIAAPPTVPEVSAERVEVASAPPVLAPAADTAAPDFSKYVDEQQKAVVAAAQAEKTANAAELDAVDAQQKMQSQQKINDALAKAQANLEELQRQSAARMEQARVDSLNAQQSLLQAANNAPATGAGVDINLPEPVMVAQSGAPAVATDSQGQGPLSSEEITKGLLPASEMTTGGSNKSPAVSLEINFKTGSSVLTTDGLTQVGSLAGAMKKEEFNSSTFQIIGHTDTVGTPESNQILSQQRAQAVVDILNKQYGIPLSQMSASGAGQWQLKVPILGDVAANRRVEIIATPRK